MTASFSGAPISARILQIRKTLPPTVRLIAVTKQVSAEAVRAAYMAGVRDFGESRIQEAIAKQAELADLTDITWHFIGHLQTNKVQQALTHFDWIHSVDSLKLAKRLNHLAAELPHPPHCCLQVKIVPDPPKYGFDIDDLWQALPQLDQCTALKIVGLMTIPPYGRETAELQMIFQQARELASAINQRGFSHIQMQQLSMGMSADYPIAIAAGATLIRLGSTIFGARPNALPQQV
ncbi:MAG: YggS family pyridoxal phosphate-dependent enzyme [Leptolyngbyaceae cyanobacterium MO_188.B28]|nr:YggS family pyridoxal phosphate-dependent enzyme [Leptolyngbyaceae cyanobacterium MO_188.B28]